MPFCPSCGNNVAPDFAFCPRCGAKLPLDANPNGLERAKLRIETPKIADLLANYEGFLKDGIPEGRGTARYDNGDTYDGEWKEGVKHGQGVYTWPDGRKYEGQFRDDYLCGQGTMFFPDGNRYEGEFAKDQMNGHGIMIFKNADRCVGEWENGNPSGHYRFYFSDGYFLDGESIRFMGDDPVFRGVVRDNNGKSYYY